MRVVKYTYPVRSHLMMKDPYTGPSIILPPFFIIFGKTLFATRIARSIFTVLNVLLTYLIGKELFDSKVGLLAVTLAIFLPFLVLTKFGNWVYITFFGLASVYSWVRNLRKPTLYKSFITGLIIGLGIYQKLEIGYVLIILFALTIFLKKRKWAPKDWRNFLLPLTIAIVLGATPLIYYNLQNGFATIDYINKAIGFPSTSSKILDMVKRFRQVSWLISPSEKIFNVLSELPGTYIEIFGIYYLPYFILFTCTGISLSKGKKNGDYILIFIIFLLIVLNSFVPHTSIGNPVNINDMLLILPFTSILVSRSLLLIYNQKFFYILAVSVVLLGFINLYSYGFFFMNLQDENWMDKNLPVFSPVHTKARLKMNKIYSLKNPFTMPHEARSINILTKNICKTKKWSQDGGTFLKPVCANLTQTINCKEENRIIIPYPSYRPHGSNIWKRLKRGTCDSPTINKSSCYKPYQFLIKKGSSKEIEITEKSYVKDLQGKRVYVILNIKC